jgi:hypothetical protein
VREAYNTFSFGSKATITGGIHAAACYSYLIVGGFHVVWGVLHMFHGLAKNTWLARRAASRLHNGIAKIEQETEHRFGHNAIVTGLVRRMSLLTGTISKEMSLKRHSMVADIDDKADDEPAEASERAPTNVVTFDASTLGATGAISVTDADATVSCSSDVAIMNRAVEPIPPKSHYSPASRRSEIVVPQAVIGPS